MFYKVFAEAARSSDPEEDAEFTTKNQHCELFYNQPEQAEANEQWQSQLINGYGQNLKITSY